MKTYFDDQEVPYLFEFERYQFGQFLLSVSEGVKMGKTEKGTLWVSREKTSAFEFFQHFVNCLDADVERLLRFFTKIDVEEIEKMCKLDIIKAKKLMALLIKKFSCHYGVRIFFVIY